MCSCVDGGPILVSQAMDQAVSSSESLESFASRLDMMHVGVISCRIRRSNGEE